MTSMAIKFRPVNQVAHRKAAQIPENTWNEHKAEIVHQYRLGGNRGGVTHALSWIVSQNIPNFKPTRRQLDLQLGSWGVKPGKLEAAHESTIGVPSKTMLRFEESSRPTHGLVPEISKTQDVELPHTGLRSLKHSSVDDPIFQESKKRKLVQGGAEHETQRIDVAILSNSDPEEDTSNVRLEIMKRQAGLFIETLEMVGVISNEAQIHDLAQGFWYEPPFSVKDLRLIEEAANFFVAAKINTTAFIMYAVLLAFYIEYEDRSERKLYWLRLCVVAASSDDDLKLVQNFVRREILRTKCSATSPIERFMLHALSMEVYERMNKLSAATNQLQDGTAILQASLQIGEGASRRIYLNMSSYFILENTSRVLKEHKDELGLKYELRSSRGNSLIGLHTLERELHKLRRGFIDSGERILDNQTIQDCLNWCHETLHHLEYIPKSVRGVQSLLWENKDWANSVSVYLLLWKEWQLRKRGRFKTLSWEVDVEKHMGISPPELLFEVASLVLSLGGKEHEEPVSRALDGANILRGKAGPGFVDLLYPFDNLYRPRGDRDLDPGTQSIVSAKSSIIFNDGMTMPPYLPEPNFSPDQAAFAYFAAFKSTGFDPPMAPSCTTTSSLASLRNQACRVSRKSPTLSESSSWEGYITAMDSMSDSMSSFSISASPFPIGGRNSCRQDERCEFDDDITKEKGLQLPPTSRCKNQNQLLGNLKFTSQPLDSIS